MSSPVRFVPRCRRLLFHGLRPRRATENLSVYTEAKPRDAYIESRWRCSCSDSGWRYLAMILDSLSRK
ncbi:MAG: hypothetical protein ACFFGP_15030 [Promethearchaeota archaeon]